MKLPTRLPVRLPRRLALGILAAAGLFACGPDPDLVVYCALDQVFSEPLIREFEKETGLVVDDQYDFEASKTVGLVRRILEEKNRTRCDVFWNNEIAQTIRLAEADMLASYDSPSAADIPALFRDSQSRWTGFGARARVLIVNTDLADPAEITSLWDLLDPKWAGKCGIAMPLTGTTLTHACALYQVLGEEPAREFLEALRAANEKGHVNLAQSNGQVMTQVANGDYAWGWTDTDDFNVAREDGYPVAAVYPDAEAVPGKVVNGKENEALGTLLIPNTISILKDAPHEAAAQRFLDWVLSKETEALLAEARSAQIPVRADVARPAHVRGPDSFRVMQVDYEALGRDIERRTAELTRLFRQ